MRIRIISLDPDPCGTGTGIRDGAWSGSESEMGLGPDPCQIIRSNNNKSAPTKGQKKISKLIVMTWLFREKHDLWNRMHCTVYNSIFYSSEVTSSVEYSRP